jgi:MFS family permease
VTPRERWWLYLVASAASGLTLGLVAILPAMPRIQEALDIPTSQVGWFTTVYLVPTVVLTLPAGVLIARLNAGRLFGPILIVYGLAGIAQAAVASYSAILPLRVLQGVCVALAMPMTITLIADIFEQGRQIRALSVRQIVLTLGGVAWPLIGTTLATFAWQAPFLLQGVLLPIGLVLLLRPPPTVRMADGAVTLHARLLNHLRDEPVAASVLALNFAR